MHWKSEIKQIHCIHKSCREGSSVLTESRISKFIIFPSSNINYELVHIFTEVKRYL